LDEGLLFDCGDCLMNLQLLQLIETLPLYLTARAHNLDQAIEVLEPDPDGYPSETIDLTVFFSGDNHGFLAF
jgi:hypothetical protein